MASACTPPQAPSHKGSQIKCRSWLEVILCGVQVPKTVSLQFHFKANREDELSPRTRRNKSWNTPERKYARAFRHGEIESRDVAAFEGLELAKVVCYPATSEGL